jgi:tyrosine-protein kinase Etk/Wzc
MAIIIGAFIGFGGSLTFEYFDNTIKSVEFIEHKKLPILAIIPSITHDSNNSNIYNDEKKGMIYGLKSVDRIQRRLVTHEDPRSPIAESYRSLRSSLMYTTKNNQSTIMVSSPGPGEGKTTTIINLAITYANMGKKTILIDGDLRKPVLHKVFNSNNKKGLTHYLSGIEEERNNIINNTEVNNLKIIYSGVIPPNPSELLGSEVMNSLVDKLKNDFDIILFDAPPVLAVTDAVVLSRLIDQFILVVRFGSTDKDSINHTLVSLANVNRPLTGIVFNDLNSKNSYYSKNYYSYQDYYSSEEETG